MKKKTGKKLHAYSAALLSCQMPLSNSWKVWISPHFVQKMHMFTWWPIVKVRCMVIESTGGEAGEKEGWNGNVAEAQRNCINLSECICSWAFDRNGDGRMWSREGDAYVRKCNNIKWLATEVLWFCPRPEHWLFVMPKYSRGKGIALRYFQPAVVKHVVASGHAGLVRVWLMVMM